MADLKISELTNLTAADPVSDMLPIVDVSATPPASGSTKRISINNLLSSSPTASGALTVTGLVTAGSATITGDLTVDTSTLKVDSTNNRVGIGTASPNGPLDVQANSAATAISIRGRVSANVGTLRWFQNNGTTETAAIESYDTGFEFRTLTAVPSIFITNSSERYRIASDGVATWSNVGGILGTAMTLNSTVLAMGVTPAPWASIKAIQVGDGASLFGYTATEAAISGNVYYNAGFKYVGNGQASQYQQQVGEHRWFSAANNTAGAGAFIAFGDAKMTLDASGGLHVGTTAYVGVGNTVINSLSGFNLVPNNTGNAANRNWQFAANGSAAGNLDFTVSSANNTYPNFAYRMQLTSAGALNNTTGTYGTISDLRLKENVCDARNYLADLLKLRVVKYSLKEESSAVHLHNLNPILKELKY